MRLRFYANNKVSVVLVLLDSGCNLPAFQDPDLGWEQFVNVVEWMMLFSMLEIIYEPERSLLDIVN